jgi:hypothetical protein
MLRIVIAIGAYFGLAILANAFAVYFVTQEHYIYYWDWSGYWDRYREISASLLVHPISTLHSLIGSVRHDDYNSLPVLILVPFEWLFGSSRLAYILAITNLLLLPAALTMGLFAERVSRLGSLTKAFSPLILVLAILTILMLHPLWIPVLRGLPDIVGIIVIGIILFLHFTKPITELRLLNLVVTGLLLCILVLLRRWYMFWVVAFFPALALAHGLDIFHRHGLAWRQYAPAARNTVLIGITFTVALFGVATPLVWREIHTNYSDIYSAYRSSGSFLETASHIPSYFGWIVIIGGLSGLAWIAARRETRLLGSFLIAQFLIVFLLFARTQDFGIQHYYLLIPELSLGIAIVVVRLSELNINLFWRSTSVACLMIFMLANSSDVMLPRAENLTNVFGRLLPSVRYYPLTRNDIDVIGQLLDQLETLELKQRGYIYVLASSAILNSDILENHCELGPKHRSFCDRILTSADVDKRDGFPRQFLYATYLVVADPTQYHLRPEDQRVIGVLVRDVRNGDGIGAAFQRLPDEFKLADGVTAWVYRKIQPFERADLQALADEFDKYYPDKSRIFRTVDE